LLTEALSFVDADGAAGKEATVGSEDWGVSEGDASAKVGSDGVGDDDGKIGFAFVGSE